MEPKTKKWKTEKVKTDMLRSIGKRYGESVQSVLKKKRKAAVGILQKRKVLNLGWNSERVMDEWWVHGTDGWSATQTIGYSFCAQCHYNVRLKTGISKRYLTKLTIQLVIFLLQIIIFMPSIPNTQLITYFRSINNFVVTRNVIWVRFSFVMI